MVNVEQVFNPDFLTKLSGAVDRFYDSEQGAFNQGYEHFHNAAGQATLVAAAAEEFGLPWKIVGTHNLPNGTTHPEGEGAGYDWAVVDGNWVVDLWRMSYHEPHPDVVFDLREPGRHEAAEQCFGPTSTWRQMVTDPKEIELAKKLWHNFTLPQRAVDDLLGGLPER